MMTDNSSLSELITITNASVCHNGSLLEHQTIQFSTNSGLIVSASHNSQSSTDGHQDTTTTSSSKQSSLQFSEDDIIAPGLLELQTNGLAGVHFTTLVKDDYESKLLLVAQEMARNGVTGWYATIPTVAEYKWKEILPLLLPRTFTSGSPLLGAHVEGPYLHPSKKGAHNDSYFRLPSLHPFRNLYGEDNLRDIIKYITIAPELDGALDMIRDITESYPHIVISLGHSTASYVTGVQAVRAGARSLTHVFNAMNALHHRETGLVGLMAMPVAGTEGVANVPNLRDIGLPYFTIIPDLIHLHPAILHLCYRADPSRCILITDSIELAGLADGTYPPNGQIMYRQRKRGNRAVKADIMEGESEILIGSCITLAEGIKHMVAVTGISLAEAVRCASTNVAALMRARSRGELVAGKRADFVIFDKSGLVKQTWIDGRIVYQAHNS